MCKNAFDEIIRKLSQYLGLGQSQNITPRQGFIGQLAAGVIVKGLTSPWPPPEVQTVGACILQVKHPQVQLVKVNTIKVFCRFAWHILTSSYV